MTDEKQLDRRQLKFLPRSRMLFKMTIFGTIVIITHVTVNRIVLCFPPTATAGRRHIHLYMFYHTCSHVLSFFETYYEATAIISYSVVVLLFSALRSFNSHIYFTSRPCATRTPVISEFGWN
jgi:hypothetical protein